MNVKINKMGIAMKLFDTFEAVKFVQEDMIFITNEGYLWYVEYVKLHLLPCGTTWN